jgi:hypothetical protein
MGHWGGRDLERLSLITTQVERRSRKSKAPSQGTIPGRVRRELGNPGNNLTQGLRGKNFVMSSSQADCLHVKLILTLEGLKEVAC